MGLVCVLQNTDKRKSGVLKLNNLTYSFCLTNTTYSSNSFSVLTGATKLPGTCSRYLSPPLSLRISKFAFVPQYHAVRSNTRHLINLHAFFASSPDVKINIAYNTEDQNFISITLLWIFPVDNYASVYACEIVFQMLFNLFLAFEVIAQSCSSWKKPRSVLQECPF